MASQRRSFFRANTGRARIRRALAALFLWAVALIPTVALLLAGDRKSRDWQSGKPGEFIAFDAKAETLQRAPRPQAVELPEGEHRIEVHKDGFATYSSSIRVRRGETTTVNVSLARE